MTHRTASRFAALIVAAAPLLASCTSMLDEQTIGTPATPAGGAQFARYFAIGTSLSAGVQSDGLNDSTQRTSFTYQLATAMGLTPGADWFYPSMNMPGCPAPFINPLANNGVGQRVGGAPNPPAAGSCRARATASIKPFMNNAGIPRMRAAQALDATTLFFPTTDVEFGPAAQFITGAVAPVNMILPQRPTFVTIEVGANDVLLGATRGDTTLLTSVAAFTTAIGAIRDSLNTLNPVPGVAISNVPTVTVIPHFTRATVLFCLKTGACPGVPATLPYSSPAFTVDPSCAPNLAGGIGDNYLLTLGATAKITGVLALGLAAKVDCLRDSALIATAPAAPATVSAGPTLNAAESAAIAARITAFNAAITTLATGENWAFVDLNAALLAGIANIPSIPNFGNQLALFACPSPGCPTGTATVFSQDGVHPNVIGYRVMAQAFAAAINARYSATLVVP